MPTEPSNVGATSPNLLLQTGAEMHAVVQAIPDLVIRLDAQAVVLDCKVGAASTGRGADLSTTLKAGPATGIGAGGNGSQPSAAEIAAAHVGPVFRAAVARVVARGEMEAIEYILESHGQTSHYEARLAPVLARQVVAFVRDVTARKCAEEELFESREMLRQVLDTIPQRVFWKDRSSVYLGCNQLFADDAGLAGPAAVAGRTDLEVNPPEFAARYRADDAAVMASDRAKLDYEEQVERSDGTRGWLRTSKVPLHDKEGRVIGIFGTYENITGRKQAEALRAGENRILELIVRGAPLPETLCELARTMESQSPGMLCAVLTVDPEARCLRAVAAPSFPPEFPAAVNGIPVREGAGPCGTAAARKQVVIVTDMQTDPLAEGYRDLAARIGVRAVWSAPILAHDDTVLATFAMYSREPRGPTPEELQLSHFASHIAGIAIQRTRAEDALRKAEEKYRNIFENALNGIFQITPEGRILEANPAFARMCGYESPAALRAGVTDVARQLFLDGPRYAEFGLALREMGRVQRWELPMRNREQEALWVSIDARLARAADGQTLCYEGFAEDVTERKRLEQQFLQSQKMEAFGQLAGGVAHDFNNLLTVILGNLSLLRLGGLPVAHNAIEDCFRAAQRAANLTSQLLTFSRRQPVEPRDLDLNEVVANMTKMLHPIIGEHIVLETAFAPGDAAVRADPGMMEQALMNLALNSRDAMPKGGTLRVSTARVNFEPTPTPARPGAPDRAGSFVRLTVGDTGAGIAPEHLPHIFEPFFTTKEVGRGTGLGLATVFGIVEQHEGWIEVESEPGKGTRVHVFLPRIDGGPWRAPAGLVGASVPRGGTETILLAEDENDVRTLMSQLLERHGYRVLAAANGVEALELWRAHRDRIDLLVTDMVMPGGISGRELGERVRADQPGLRILYCSGYTDEMLGGQPLRESADFLAKPFDVHVFLGRVRACLDSSR